MRTNRKLRMALANGLVSLGLLLGAGAAQATTVIRIGDNALEILNLDVPGFEHAFDVVFRLDSADTVYGSDPAVFDFTSDMDAAAAIDAVNVALDTEGGINGVTEIGFSHYLVGFNQDGFFVESLMGFCCWQRLDMVRQDLPSTDRPWADFTMVPEPGTAALLGLGLAGLGVVGRSRREESQGTA